MSSLVEEKQEVELEGRRVPVTVRRHRKARRVSLRIAPAGDGVVLTLPMRASLEKGLRFAQAKASWIFAHLASAPPEVRLVDGAAIPVLGKNYRVCRQEARGLARLTEDGLLLVHGAPEFTHRRVKDFLKNHIRAYCEEQAYVMAAQLGKKVRSVRVAEMRSRWGSCNAAGNLAFNWRLVFAPLVVTDYLVAHEVAHLAEMNHSPRFWQHVAALCPEHKAARAWLRREGQGLYRYK